MFMRIRTLISSLCVACGLVGSLTAAEHTKDSLETVKKLIAENKAVLVDVREASEWNAGHLQDAVHIPLSRIKNGLSPDELSRLTGEGKIIYLHCRSGARCLDAAQRLAGFQRDLRPLQSGYEQLLKAQIPKAK
jgi:phage shock protein E